MNDAAREVAFEPRGYAVLVIPERLAARNRGRVLVLGGGARPPALDGIESIAGFTFVDNGRVVAEERDDAVDVALGIELEVAPDDLGEVVERELLPSLRDAIGRSAEAKTERPAYEIHE